MGYLPLKPATKRQALLKEGRSRIFNNTVFSTGREGRTGHQAGRPRNLGLVAVLVFTTLALATTAALATTSVACAFVFCVVHVRPPYGFSEPAGRQHKPHSLRA